MSSSAIPLGHHKEWVLPYHGTVAMLALIVAEIAIFSIFVVAYIYYIGKSISGPQPREVLELRSSTPYACYRAVSPSG